MEKTFFGRAKSLTGAVLVAFGAFIFYENLSHLLGTISGEAPGAIPTVVLAAARALQDYAVDHHRFLHSFVQHVLVSCWPLLLVMVGMVLSRDSLTDNVNAHPKNEDCALVDLTARRSTLK